MSAQDTTAAEFDIALVEAIASRTAELLGVREQDRLEDAAAVSERLSVPKTWVLAEARAGRIPHVRIGKYVRFRPAEVDDWLHAKCSARGVIE